MSHDNADGVVCAICGQGWLRRMRVCLSRQLVLVCEECESTWLLVEQGPIGEPMALVAMLRSIGLRGLWSDLEEAGE